MNIATSRPFSRLISSHLLPVLVCILGIALTLTLEAWHMRQNAGLIERQLGYESRDLRELVTSEMRRYEYALQGMRSAYLNHGNISPANFAAIVASHGVSEFPAAVVFVFACIVTHDALANYVREQQKQRHSFTIKSGTNTDFPLHYVVEMQEPRHRSRPILGLDLASYHVFRQAAFTAMQTDKPVLSAPVNLEDGSESDSFVLFLPVYRPSATAIPSEARADAIIGWFFVRLKINDVFLE